MEHIAGFQVLQRSRQLKGNASHNFLRWTIVIYIIQESASWTIFVDEVGRSFFLKELMKVNQSFVLQSFSNLQLEFKLRILSHPFHYFSCHYSFCLFVDSSSHFSFHSLSKLFTSIIELKELSPLASSTEKLDSPGFSLFLFQEVEHSRFP